jgi:predicted GH43/DUF377 family glycosyl hydrolase
VFNCGATIYNGKVLLLYRAQGDDKISRLGMALLDDGIHVQERLENPVLVPDIDNEYETHGIEDPRITQINGAHYIVYTAASMYPPLAPRPTEGALPGDIPWRVRVSLAHTHDFRSFHHHGVIIDHIDSKDAALFPEQINNNYVLLHRVYPQMRLAISENLRDFKERGIYMWPREHMWDSERVGGGPPPLKTPYGWLLIYHAVDKDLVYRLGIVIADLNDPSKILVRSDEPVFEPEESYERKGQVPNIVFSCGAVEWNDHYIIYYGATDSVIGAATVPKKEIFEWIELELKRKRKQGELSAIPAR